MTKKQKLELNWIGKDNSEYDIANIEPRILEERKDLSYGDPNSENIIIHGDNLLALKALLPEYEGKIKCIYIDPPYNTGNAFDHYDDNVEHSTWLSLMKPRLELLRMLLSEDGVILVQIDKNEGAYLKVLMDEVFLRQNFITTIAVKMSTTSGFKIEHSDKTIVKNTEYLHIYGFNFHLEPVYEEVDYDPHYSLILKKVDNQNKICSLAEEPLVKEELEKYSLKQNSKSLARLFNISVNFKNFVKKNRDIIGRIHTAPAGAVNNKELIDVLKDEKTVVSFINSNNQKYLVKKQGNKIDQYIPIALKYKLVDSTEGYSEQLSNILGDWWDGFYLDMGNVEDEGKVEFKASKKPERLIFRILNMFTNKKDLVLDSFLGSGTTAAVAHKMDRKYIGIEMGDHAYTHVYKRIKGVVDGLDQTGISKMVGWKGGGGFRFYELAPSFIVKDEFGNPVIDSYYNDVKLIKAMCKLMNYTYKPSQTEYWKHGVGQGNNYLYVTTQLLSSAMVQKIADHLGINESILICPTKYEPGAEKLNEKILVKKIPQSILKACQFGKKEYLLPIKEQKIEEESEEENL